MHRKCTGWILAVVLMFAASNADAKWHIQCMGYESYHSEYFWYDSGAWFDKKSEALSACAEVCKGERSRVTWKIF